MSPAWFAGVDTTDNVEWIDTEQRGLVLRVRRGRLVWFVRYMFAIGLASTLTSVSPPRDVSLRRPWPRGRL